MRFPRLSLVTWIALPTVFVVAGLAVWMSAMQVDTLIRAWLTGSQAIAELAGQQVKLVLVERLEEVNKTATARTVDELKMTWESAIESDQSIAAVLEASVARATSIVEISIADRMGGVLASSNRARRGRRAVNAPSLEMIQKLNAAGRIRWLFGPSSDYELRIPIGLASDPQPLFYVQVLVSSVLLREEIGPGLRRIAVASGSALALALILVIGAARLTVSNLQRIGNIIDRIAGGEPGGGETVKRPAAAAAEFAVVESKLSLLGDRIRGALHDAEAYKQRVGKLLERLREAVLLFDGDRLVLSAGAVETLLGWKDSESMGRRVGELFAANSQTGALLAHALAYGEPVHEQLVHTHVSGVPRQLLINVDLIADSATSERRLALVRIQDAEGAGELESQLQIYARLEAINRLTGGVAHEIKNPLNSIAARLALLESIVAEQAPEAAPEIQVISEEIVRLDRVVRTFLDFTQPLQIRRDRVDIADLVRELAEFFGPDAANRGVAMQVQVPAGPLPVRGDRDLLKQALLNLVINGIEAMPGGGTMKLEADSADGVCRVRISDTGTGIPESMREKIFQLYFTTKKKGSGIGLATAYRTLQLHGGSIKVESQVGAGTTFELTLPVARLEVAGA